MISFDNIVNDVVNHARETPNRECCGLIVMVNGVASYRPCRNIASESHEFSIHPEDYISCEAEGIVGVAHSHLHDSAEPSIPDLRSVEKSGVPWLIVAARSGAYKVVQPSAYSAPLIGRPYAPPMFDCYTLFRDWYGTKGITLIDFERDDEFWRKGNDMLCPSNFGKAGFYIVNAQDIKAGDGIVFKPAGYDLCSHLAVYLGNEVMLHHRRNRLSCRDDYSGIWVSSTQYVIRHVDYAD